MAKQPGICPARAALYALSLDTPMRRPHSGKLMNSTPPPPDRLLYQHGSRRGKAGADAWVTQ